MENEENKMDQEIINSEQFQVGHAPEEEKTQEQDDAQYTEDEVEFADGEGTSLAEEFEVPEKEDLEEVPGTVIVNLEHNELACSEWVHSCQDSGANKSTKIASPHGLKGEVR